MAKLDIWHLKAWNLRVLHIIDVTGSGEFTFILKAVKTGLEEPPNPETVRKFLKKLARGKYLKMSKNGVDTVFSKGKEWRKLTHSVASAVGRTKHTGTR